MESVARRDRVWSIATVLARFALAAGFLSAIADRFGWWGPPHTSVVGWGNFAEYTAYMHTLAPYVPDGLLLNVAAWASTTVETVLGLTLLVGLLVRWSACAAAVLLVIFALSMALFLGAEAPLSASVPAAAAAALLLALSPVDTFALSLDRIFASNSPSLEYMEVVNEGNCRDRSGGGDGWDGVGGCADTGAGG
jgi:uncharacterized membrane protein YphA (DoxX/SURF4 family)